ECRVGRWRRGTSTVWSRTVAGWGVRCRSTVGPCRERVRGAKVPPPRVTGTSACTGPCPRSADCTIGVQTAPDRPAVPDGARALSQGQRSASSSANRASVPGSRSLTTRVVAIVRPRAAAQGPVAGREPGTTTAPAGTTSGRSAVPSISRSRTRSNRREVPVRTTPAPITAPRETNTPSSNRDPAPTNASSSTITGRAPAGSRTPPIVTPAARWTRAPIWAHDPTSTCESTIVPAPTHAPTLTYDGGITTTPGSRWAPLRIAVPPGTIRRSGPGSIGGKAARSRKASGPASHAVDVRSANAARIAAFTSGLTRQPSGAVGSGSAARSRPAVRSASMSPTPGRRSPRSRRHLVPCPDPPAGGFRQPEIAERREQLDARRRRKRQKRQPDGVRFEQPHERECRLHGDRVRAAAEVREEQRQPAVVDPARPVPVASGGCGAQRDQLAGDLVAGHGDDAVAAHREHRQGPRVVAGEDRDVARPVAADPGDLLQVPARLLDRDDAGVLGEAQEDVRRHVRAGPRRDVVH